MNKYVQRSLVELFMHLADAVDGGEPLPEHLYEAYNEEMDKEHMMEFYGQLIEENHKTMEE